MNLERPKALVVDKESPQTKELIVFLEESGFHVFWAKDGEQAYNILDSEDIDAMITELRVHRIDGLALMAKAKQRNSEVCAIVIAAGNEIEPAVEAMKQGAYDFQVKPLNLDKIGAVLERGLSHQRLVLQVSDLKSRLEGQFGFERIVGNSTGMRKVCEKIAQIAPTRADVLVMGETGTGKELVAHAIHQHSRRKDEAFVKVSCAALPEGIIESELFGHEKGAFTGAAFSRRGRFEIADKGTLFLDDVSDIPMSVQVKLLRVLQEREFERVGGSETIKVNVRIIATTNQDLEKLVKKGIFRKDLYYRLKVATLEIPPLRERLHDIPLLVDAFVKGFNEDHERRISGVTRGFMDMLMQYDWPGNVRELRNTLEGMVVFSSGRRTLDVSDLPNHLRNAKHAGQSLVLRVGMTMEEIEKRAIEESLKATGFDKQKAAELLGIGLRTLYRKQKEYGIK